MAIYDFIKDALTIAQQADNVDLYKKLLEIGRMALELQNENAELKKKIEEYAQAQKFEEDIVRHTEPYYTLKSEGEESDIYYCATCFGKENKKIQMVYMDGYKLWCPACKTSLHKTKGRTVQTIYF